MQKLQKLAKEEKTCKRCKNLQSLQKTFARKADAMASTNPFTPTFGIIPPFMAGRELLIEEISTAFTNGLGDPNLCTILSGARGAGKTALLSFLASEAESRGWVSARVTACKGMLDDVFQQATWNARAFLNGMGGRRLRGVSLGQLVGFEWENEPAHPGNWRLQMNALLDQLEEQEIGLLITVDEVKVSYEEMKRLAQVYQHFVTEGRKVALLMAGLPHNVSQLLRDDDVSFLRRARRHSLGRISDREIREAFALTVGEGGKAVADSALDRAVEATDGFPYMMQLVGYYSWVAAGERSFIEESDVSHGVGRARHEMVEGILEYTYRELSDGDKKFLSAMLADEGDSSLASVAERMGVKSNYASQYKRRLLEQGVIGEAGKGHVRFDMPVFREYFAERVEEDAF